jgi:hypothetical protein
VKLSEGSLPLVNFRRRLPYGRLALVADPFGHGFCLIQFNERGYDAIAG